MNPVSMPAASPVPGGAPANATGNAKAAATARGQQSREAQAAFSPALLMLLAPTLPTPIVVAPGLAANVATPDAAEWTAAAIPMNPEIATIPLTSVPTPPTPTPSFGDAVFAAAPRPGANRTTITLANTAASVAAAATAEAAAVNLDAAPASPAATLPAVTAAVTAPAASAQPAVVSPTPSAHATPAAPDPAIAQGLAPAAALTATLQVATMRQQGSAQSTEPDPREREHAPATGAAVVEVVRRAAAVAGGAASRQKTGGQDTKQNGGDATQSRATAASRAGTGRPSGLTRLAPESQAPAAAETRAAQNSAAPAAAPAQPATDTTHAVSGAPADPRLSAMDPSAMRGTKSDQITLRVEDEQGVEARLRVAVRGREVRATIVADDPAMAKRLEEGLGHLRQALGARGFDRTQVAVQSAGSTRDDAGKDGSRDARDLRRDADGESKSESNSTNGRRSETPDQRSRRRGGRDAEER